MPDVEIRSDGKTVWVNGPEVCLGRFGPRGVDVHNDAAGQMEGHQCLDCRQEPDWEAFKASMLKYHEVEVSDDYRPDWVTVKPHPYQGLEFWEQGYRGCEVCGYGPGAAAHNGPRES